MAHRWKSYARYIQKQLDIPYKEALSRVIAHIDEAIQANAATKERLLNLCRSVKKQ